MLIVKCPHCEESIQIEEIACEIFRHAVFKSNMQQIPPHSPKEECQQLLDSNKVYGCAKPFQILTDNDKIIVKKCDYI